MPLEIFCEMDRHCVGLFFKTFSENTGNMKCVLRYDLESVGRKSSHTSAFACSSLEN